MPNEGGEYKSIEEVRSAFYPHSASMLNLEKEDILEFPTNLADESLQTIERIGQRAAQPGEEQESSSDEP
jgi:hypothetical protein